MEPAKPPRRHRFGLPALRRILAGIPALLFALVIYGYLALPDVRSLATENPAMTAFMQLRAEQTREQGRIARRMQRWVSYSHISPELRRAVPLAEDSAF